MGLEQLLERVPDYAKDLRLNLTTLLRQTEMTPEQTWGTAVACAFATRNAALAAAVEEQAAGNVSADVVKAAKGAAAIMGMNNVYYRFLHMTENESYKTMPARLRMNIMRTHGVPEADFELWCTAVSAINNCHVCTASHEKSVREKGIAPEAILASIRIAAVVNALAGVLDTVAVPEPVVS